VEKKWVFYRLGLKILPQLNIIAVHNLKTKSSDGHHPNTMGMFVPISAFLLFFVS